MQISTLINHSVPTLQPSDSVADALDWLQEYGIKQLAIVKDGIYKGMAEASLIGHWEEDTLLEHIPALNPELIGFEKQDIIEVLPYFFNKTTSVETLAIQNSEHYFIGVLLKKEVVEAFLLEQNWHEVGAVLVLQFGMERDYSLSEVSRLIESNHVKILSSFVQTNNQSYFLTVKLNSSDISAVVATLERYDYTIVRAFLHKPIENLEQDRYENLMRYLEV